MKKGSTILALCGIVIFALTLSDCGSGGGGTTLLPPTYNASGTWYGTQTAGDNNCNVSVGTVEASGTGTITQSVGSNSLTLTDSSDHVYQGTMSGNIISYSGAAYYAGCTSAYETVTLTMSSATSANGQGSVNCSYSGGSCSGTINFTYTKM